MPKPQEPDVAEDYYPEKQPIILAFIENALLSAGYSPNNSNCSGENETHTSENILQCYDNVIRSTRDNIKLKEPIYNKTHKLYIQMFFEILQEIELVMSYKPRSDIESNEYQEVDRWARHIRNILCKFMPKIDLSHDTRFGLFEVTEKYPIEMISYKRITKAFNILMECNGNIPSNEVKMCHSDREASIWLARIQKFVLDDLESDL